jgi:hypothetical protein
VRSKKGKPLSIPSKAHQIWFLIAMTQAPAIRRGLAICGFDLPIRTPVKVEAVFYRDAERGDLIGYEESLADWMQTAVPTKSGGFRNNGAGIILDDRQIVGWGESRMDKDAEHPRIEVEVTVL